MKFTFQTWEAFVNFGKKLFFLSFLSCSSFFSYCSFVIFHLLFSLFLYFLYSLIELNECSLIDSYFSYFKVNISMDLNVIIFCKERGRFVPLNVTATRNLKPLRNIATNLPLVIAVMLLDRYLDYPTSTLRVFHVEKTRKQLFPRYLNVEYTYCVCMVH